MNRANFVCGAIGVAVGGGAYFRTSDFPADVVMKIGPAFFPSMLAGGLMLSSAALMVIAAMEAAQPAAPDAEAEPFRLSLGDGRVRAVVTTLAVLAFTLVLVPLGFIPTSVIFLLAMMALLGVRRPLLMAATSVGVTLGIWLIFEKLLVLTLPAGILESVLY